MSGGLVLVLPGGSRRQPGQAQGPHTTPLHPLSLHNIAPRFLMKWQIGRGLMSSATAQEHTFIGPGLSPFKRIVTIIGVVGITALVLAIALHQGASAIGSTIAAVLFILGFVIYLRIVAPVPFTITLEPEAVVKRNKNGE